MLTETPRGGVDSRTHVGVSREHPPSIARSSIAPGPLTVDPGGSRPTASPPSRCGAHPDRSHR